MSAWWCSTLSPPLQNLLNPLFMLIRQRIISLRAVDDREVFVGEVEIGVGVEGFIEFRDGFGGMRAKF